ncbi:MAG: hypothetical protein ABII00_03695 [Elusimicrobiota bacterium]
MKNRLVVIAVLAAAVAGQQALPGGDARARDGDARSPAPAPDGGAGRSPVKEPAPMPNAEDSELRRSLRKELLAHIRNAVDEGSGLFPVDDGAFDQTYFLEFKRIDPAGMRRVSADKYILRAEFMEPSDLELDDRPVRAVVDFTLARTDGAWRVADKALFSVDGEERFGYGADHQRIPLKPAAPSSAQPAPDDRPRDRPPVPVKKRQPRGGQDREPPPQEEGKEGPPERTL